MDIMADCSPTLPLKFKKKNKNQDLSETKYPISCFAFKKKLGLVIT